ncbi:tRNA (adenosine(37)-N6)-threonylcarbamoyltransferase complex dimerization subunit type 1 TsaB [Algoriphagus machipongonensis]|uniref:Glycoprotease family protein n=1 Tax=Algoriphagus machipongonensis TaxID=388413 RepID=A3HX68_9BACT|nr:tRNA (adenosine(37)-N6)-threonylcarbamoyltransferase complex dimerization subunit type 1 TsaB [Algoriphagus machipongonensis]EAZ81191.1 glycoprotease family protein [Algoriphagus machipongonensis]
MAKILSLETSTPVCSVALHDSGNIMGLKEIEENGAHSEKLIKLIEELLDELQVDRKEVDAIAVSEGPGSYTGLRIGVSTAKGLAFAWGKPLIAVSTLAALARGATLDENNSSVVIAMLDARRMEVYREIFDANMNSMVKLDSEIVEEDSFSDYLNKSKVVFIGDAVLKVKEVIRHSNAVFSDKRISASEVGEIAWEKYQNQVFEDIAYFVPNYLKELKVLKSKKNPLLRI